MKSERWLNHDGFWSQRLPGWWRALCFCTLCCIGPLLLGLPSYASEPNDLIASLRMHLQNISAQAASLENESRTLKALSDESELRVSELQQELSALRQELEAWQISSVESQKQVESLRESLDASTRKLTQVSAILRASADSWKTVADAERRVTRKWKFAAIVGGVCALLAGGTIGYFVGRTR